MEIEVFYVSMLLCNFLIIVYNEMYMAHVDLKRMAEEEANAFIANPDRSLSWKATGKDAPDFLVSVLARNINEILEARQAALRVVFDYSEPSDTNRIYRSGKESRRETGGYAPRTYNTGGIMHSVQARKPLMHAMELGDAAPIDAFLREERESLALGCKPENAETYLRQFDADAALLKQLALLIPDLYRTPKGTLPESLRTVPADVFESTDIGVQATPAHTLLVDRFSKDEVARKLEKDAHGGTRLVNAHRILSYHLIASGHCDGIVYTGNPVETSRPYDAEAGVFASTHHGAEMPMASTTHGELDDFLQSLK